MEVCNEELILLPELKAEENLEYSTIDETVQEFPPAPLFSCKTLLELAICSWSKANRCSEDIQPYIRGCKWSPDGTCCLNVVNNDGVHVCELARDLYEGPVNPARPVDILDSVIHVKEAGLVYDFAWNPNMDSRYPETCFWITTIKNAPIQMWDAFDGSLRCSYLGINTVDEMEPALSVTFSPDCKRIIGGYKKCLRTFDIERPGKEFAEHKTTGGATACMATNDNMLAAGSWSSCITLYCINNLGTYKSLGKLHGHSGGVTHMQFTPDGTKLVSGGRNDNKLLVWDLRYMQRPLNILTRTVDTNQRIYFDISPCGRYLATGGTDGIVRVWDSDECDWSSRMDYSDTVCYKFPLYKDCCNSISIHPQRPIMATGSGQYHLSDPALDLADEDSVSDAGEDQITSNYKYSGVEENHLNFWWIAEVPDG